LASISVSTYPLISNDPPVRLGEPIAGVLSFAFLSYFTFIFLDCSFCQIHHNFTVLGMADGCNWGSKPFNAANDALTAIKEGITEKKVSKWKTTQVCLYHFQKL
jgi:hypothetical protein